MSANPLDGFDVNEEGSLTFTAPDGVACCDNCAYARIRVTRAIENARGETALVMAHALERSCCYNLPPWPVVLASDWCRFHSANVQGVVQIPVGR